MRDLRRVLREIDGMNVLVIGDAMLDRYVRGSSSRLAQEAPVPVVAVTDTEECPGGAANTAANAAGLGARTTLLTAVGDDPAGASLRRLLETHGVAVAKGSTQALRRTLSKTRIVADGHMLVRIDEGTTGPPHGWDGVALSMLAEAWEEAAVVIVSDYGYGAVTPTVIESISELQSRSPRVLAVDSKNLEAFRAAAPTLVKPNFEQAGSLLGANFDPGPAGRAGAVADSAKAILERTGANIAAITLDADGAIVLATGCEPYRTFTRGVQTTRTVGAGDTYLSAFALALGARANVPEAADFAALAARHVVREDGTAICSRASLLRDAERTAPQPSAEGELLSALNRAREGGKRIVFTNGVFDILHSGHVKYLERASQLGDILVVGVNSDQSVRRIKGPGRPVNTASDRMAVIAALDFVDHVLEFGEATPERLIRLVKPDVFAKGGDYTRESLPEAPLVEELGGAVVILDYEDSYSTTGIIHRIQQQAENGGSREGGVPVPVPNGHGSRKAAPRR